MLERVRYALAGARAAKSLEHAGVKGAIREVLMTDLFRPLLPADIGIASGVLISAFGQGQSAQQDVIIFDKRIIPPILFEQGPAIVPIESALVCIEIKSKLTATEMRKAHDGAKTVKNLTLLSGKRDRFGNWVDDLSIVGVVSLLLALDSDLTAVRQNEIERYKDLLAGEHPALGGICIAGRSAWFPTERSIYDFATGTYFKEDRTPIRGTWREVRCDGEHAEILEFLSAVIQMIQEIGPTRGKPPLHSYFNVTEEKKRRKIRITSGPQNGWYLGVSINAKLIPEPSVPEPSVRLGDVSYPLYEQAEAGFDFLAEKVEEIQAQLKLVGLESELV